MIQDDPNRTETTGAAGAAAARQQDPKATDETVIEAQEGVVDYAGIGQAFTDWFNAKLKLLPNATIRLGTKTAHVVALHPDGRMECEVEGESSKNEQQFVAFEMEYFDQLQRKLTALTL